VLNYWGKTMERVMGIEPTLLAGSERAARIEDRFGRPRHD
jgi:hypothetical protein